MNKAISQIIREQTRMPPMTLPTFKYHPDPVATGSIERSNATCQCCGQKRGYIYVGPVFSVEELSDSICPWCIADGSAHAKFDAEFTDAAGIGDYGSWDTVPQAVIDEVAFRTPGFSGWQQERWWTHCGDAAAFLGRAGYAEVSKYGSELINVLRRELNMDGDSWNEYFMQLDKDGSPSAYVFQCLHCGALGGYSDCD
jgi:uncharacterized protein CbrC (UPF0167 family)